MPALSLLASLPTRKANRARHSCQQLDSIVDKPLVTSPNSGTIEGMSKSKSRNNLIANDILERAATLFAERGFHGTSLQEVADATGISRPALYYYVSNKEDLFAQLVSGIGRERADDVARLRWDESLSPLDKVDGAIKVMATRIAKNPARFRLLIISEADLPEWVHREHKAAKHELLDHLSAIIAEGIEAGVLKTAMVDERILAYTVLGMCNWVAWWYHPDHESFLGGEALSPDEVADYISATALGGLKSDGERSPQEGEGDSVDRALSFVRQDLDHLERLLYRASVRSPHV